MFTDDDLLPLSALQHLLFCERQCALIHIEGLWDENPLTLEGRHLHDKAHEGADETRDGVRIARGVQLRSLKLGLVGKADVVEFPAPTSHCDPPLPFPVEYKRGKPKAHDADKVQLCAQALCLEEMLHVDIPAGALFYGRTRRRLAVTFDDALRRLTTETAARLHELIAAGHTPAAAREPKCDNCSMQHLCLPGVAKPKRTVAAYMENAMQQNLTAVPVEEEAQ